MLNRVDTVLDVISALLKYLAAALLLGVALLIATDVGLRTFFNKPIIGVAEVVANGVVIIAYLQLTYAVRIGSMLRSEFLVSQLPFRARILLETFIACLGALFFALIAWASYTPLVRAFTSGEFEGHASFQVPTWPVRFVVVACATLAILNYIVLAYRALVRGETVGEGVEPGGPDPVRG